MSAKTITYETPSGSETTMVEKLEYESTSGVWRFKSESTRGGEIMRIPRERVYEIRQQGPEQEESGRDQYGHP
ncbi:hypothetical protein [Halostagnicola sp. A-GB9-2]|uniref:hypothetical protein n=1 Tax=Halostagnicola sp. A-GB9-2 TaxID=3048066 RepID=UPI0024BFE654|nr:hypothetical protein [Halostagnicola sp. A-GB9-2]MDJ1433116.1 hypothetical protein [Halostagnicola sp. A-GB9-2]